MQASNSVLKRFLCLMLFNSVEWQRTNSTAMKFLGFWPNWLLIQPYMTLNLRNTTRHFLQKIIFIKWKTEFPKYAKKVDTNLTSVKYLAYVFSGDSWLIAQTLLLEFERRCNVNRAPVIMVNLKLNWLSWCESGESSACSALFDFVWNWYFENFCSLSHACHKTKKHFIPDSRAIFSIDLIVFLQLCRGFYHLYSKWHVIFGRA